MDAAQTIRNAVDRVSLLRQEGQANPVLHSAIMEIKAFQAWRFSQTYADELKAGPYQGAAQFFLTELYSNKDYTQRDAEFSRIAGALQKVFSKQVVLTAVSLAQLHALTEELDHAMGKAWLKLDSSPTDTDARRYAQSWQRVGRQADREFQLETVMAVGRELDSLTRAPGLRMLLKMMRRPAHAAGLSSLQQFLESGFDTFAKMSRGGRGATEFLALVHERESHLLEMLSFQNTVAFETEFRII